MSSVSRLIGAVIQQWFAVLCGACQPPTDISALDHHPAALLLDEEVSDSLLRKAELSTDAFLVISNDFKKLVCRPR